MLTPWCTTLCLDILHDANQQLFVPCSYRPSQSALDTPTRIATPIAPIPSLPPAKPATVNSAPAIPLPLPSIGSLYSSGSVSREMSPDRTSTTSPGPRDDAGREHDKDRDRDKDKDSIVLSSEADDDAGSNPSVSGPRPKADAPVEVKTETPSVANKAARTIASAVATALAHPSAERSGTATVADVVRECKQPALRNPLGPAYCQVHASCGMTAPSVSKRRAAGPLSPRTPVPAIGSPSPPLAHLSSTARTTPSSTAATTPHLGASIVSGSDLHTDGTSLPPLKLDPAVVVLPSLLSLPSIVTAEAAPPPVTAGALLSSPAPLTTPVPAPPQPVIAEGVRSDAGREGTNSDKPEL